jgi:hypothetical protein
MDDGVTHRAEEQAGEAAPAPEAHHEKRVLGGDVREDRTRKPDEDLGTDHESGVPPPGSLDGRRVDRGAPPRGRDGERPRASSDSADPSTPMSTGRPGPGMT